MILRLAILFFCIYLSTFTVRSQAAAQGGAIGLTEPLGQVTGNDADDKATFNKEQGLTKRQQPPNIILNYNDFSKLINKINSLIEIQRTHEGMLDTILQKLQLDSDLPKETIKEKITHRKTEDMEEKDKIIEDDYGQFVQDLLSRIVRHEYPETTQRITNKLLHDDVMLRSLKSHEGKINFSELKFSRVVVDLLDQNDKDIFGSPDGRTSTAIPDLQGNSGSIASVASCTCMPYYLCHNGSINTNGKGIMDISINDHSCESYIDVCCNAEDRSEVPITPAPPITKQSVCGLRHPDGVGFRITGGKEHEAQFGEFPWMVAVLREETAEGNPNKLNVYQCGGALIHPQVVVTAAHCVSGKNKSFKIRAGEWDTQSTQELYPHQDREVKTIVMHPQYYIVENDVALLHLRAPVEIAENVGTVCLPPQGTVIDSATCFATGWGKDIYGQKERFQGILKKIDLPVVPNGECQSQLRATKLGSTFKLHKSFICAGGIPGKDSCKGDGGSPLVCPIPGNAGRYYQIGIVAWGIGCGESGTPGVYANLPLFREWIDTQMKAFGLDASAYRY